MDNKKLIDDLNLRISSCTKCALCETRTQTVPGTGNINNRIMFIGEAPGEDEDISGIPFVGRAGQLLTKILEKVGFSRESVYITNTVKCRPPKNRAPQNIEMKACFNFLESQIAIINPKIIVTVGSIATKALIADLIGIDGITKIRGKIFEWKGIKVIPILHPSYLLRNPSVEVGKPKWQTWQDMLFVKSEYDKLVQ